MELIAVLKARRFAGPKDDFDSEEVLAGEGTATGALLYPTASSLRRRRWTGSSPESSRKPTR